MDKPTLTYFPARGRAEFIRVLLAEAGVDYDQRLVSPGPDFKELKKSGVLPFDALPVWDEPDGFHLAQSHALAIYLATLHGLRGKNVREAALCDQMLGAYEDLRAEMRKLALVEPDRRAPLRQELETEILPRWLGYMDRVLAGNRDGTGFVVGDDVTIADLALWYDLEIVHDNGFGALERFPRLRAFAARIAARPRIAAWISSPKRFPFAPFPR